MARVRQRVVVRGRVQGVWFRETARRRAEQLAVSGWVRNRPDGAVEAELEGAPGDVDVLLAWFEHGPPSAQVVDVTVEKLPPQGGRGFVVR